jgi:cytochrome c oxidase subunit I
MVTHESGGGHQHHEPPTGFIRKYVFSIDHKVIGIQYSVPGLVLRVRWHDDCLS